MAPNPDQTAPKRHGPLHCQVVIIPPATRRTLFFTLTACKTLPNSQVHSCNMRSIHRSSTTSPLAASTRATSCGPITRRSPLRSGSGTPCSAPRGTWPRPRGNCGRSTSTAKPRRSPRSSSPYHFHSVPSPTQGSAFESATPCSTNAGSRVPCSSKRAACLGTSAMTEPRRPHSCCRCPCTTAGSPRPRL